MKIPSETLKRWAMFQVNMEIDKIKWAVSPKDKSYHEGRMAAMEKLIRHLENDELAHELEEKEDFR